MAQIAIVGATGHIGKGLAHELNRRGHSLSLVVRDMGSAKKFARRHGIEARIHSIDQLGGGLACDLIVNAVGAGDPSRRRALGRELLDVDQRIDDRLIGTIGDSGRPAYIYLSSGAVYPGTAGSDESREDDPYVTAKRRAEARHRARPDLNIVDIRVFGYFSRFMDLDGEFFLAQLARAALRSEVFRTTSTDMIRDYACPADLATLIECCLAHPRNAAVDLYSREPAGKFAIIDAFVERHGLRIELTGAASQASRRIHRSTSRAAVELGFSPQYSSLEGILHEFTALKEMNVDAGQ